MGKHARPCFGSPEELEQGQLIEIKPLVIRMLLCAGEALLPGHALIVAVVDCRQGDVKLPKHIAPVNERGLEHMPAEACFVGVIVQRHPKATREADGEFSSQPKTCGWLIDHAA